MLRRFGAIGITLSILAAATPVAQELDRVAVIISQPTSPVEIYDFSRTDRSGRFTTTGDELYVNARWRNIVDRLIVAVEIGVLDFDVWHEFLEYQLINNFEKLEPRDDNRLNYSFTQHGTKYQITRIQTSFAYVSRVMFEDGEIWERSLEQVTEEVQKTEPDFDSSFVNEDNLRGWGSLVLP